MAKTKTPAAQETQEETQEAKVIRPNDLAVELGVDGKRIRQFLRTTFSRDDEAKNTSWVLNDEMIAAVRERFSPSEEEEVEA